MGRQRTGRVRIGAVTATIIGLATLLVSAPAASDPDAAEGGGPAPIAYVVSQDDESVTPVDTASNTAGTAIDVGGDPEQIAISADGTTAYVANSTGDSVTPIALPANTPGTPIAAVGAWDVAITPDGTTAYVTDATNGALIPITLPDNTPGTPIPIGGFAAGVAIAPAPVDCSGSVATEAEYRTAVTCFSTDASGPHTIELTDDITLDDGFDPFYSGTQPLTIDGNGHTIDATGSSRVLASQSPALLTVNGLTAANGAATGGSAILGASITVTESRFTGNFADDDGGAVFALTGDVTVTDSRFDHNGVNFGSGGGVYAQNGDVVIKNSTFDHNTVGGDGAAVYADGSLEVTSSTITDNTGATNGALSATGPITLRHATVVSNTSGAGVGANVTTTDEFISFGSVVADPLGGGIDCSLAGTTTSGYSFSSDATCGFVGVGDVENGGSPILGALRDNGGPTPTRFPLLGSPLPDHIPTPDCDPNPALDLDQRGIDRPFGAGCDLGAIEAAYGPHPFSDVTNFYEPTVRWITSDVQDPPLMVGFDNGTFRQNANITRGQAARLYYRAFGEPDVTALPQHGFTDVPNWVEDSVRWAKANGIFNGFQDNTFRPNDPISRGNYTRSLYQAAGAVDVTPYEPHGLTDITPFYENAVRWALHNGLANGFQDNTYRTGDPINRGNAARIFYNTNRAPDAWADAPNAPQVTLFNTNLGM